MRPGYSVIEAANWYAYASNNPVKYVDPTGEWEFKLGLGIGFALRFHAYGDNQGNWDMDIAVGAALS